MHDMGAAEQPLRTATSVCLRRSSHCLMNVLLCDQDRCVLQPYPWLHGGQVRPMESARCRRAEGGRLPWVYGLELCLILSSLSWVIAHPRSFHMASKVAYMLHVHTQPVLKSGVTLMITMSIQFSSVCGRVHGFSIWVGFLRLALPYNRLINRQARPSYFWS